MMDNLRNIVFFLLKTQQYNNSKTRTMSFSYFLGKKQKDNKRREIIQNVVSYFSKTHLVLFNFRGENAKLRKKTRRNDRIKLLCLHIVAYSLCFIVAFINSGCLEVRWHINSNLVILQKVMMTHKW
jgi:hypothetical protein